jgi:hypothetical protein
MQEIQNTELGKILLLQARASVNELIYLDYTMPS